MQFGLLYEAQDLRSIEMFGKYVIPACRGEVRVKPIGVGV
jgi:hypothetical protein